MIRKVSIAGVLIGIIVFTASTYASEVQVKEIAGSYETNSVEGISEAAQKVIVPLSQEGVLEASDRTYRAYFNANDFNWAENTLLFDVYVRDQYDNDDMENLKVGDAIEVGGKCISIVSITEDGFTRMTESGVEEYVPQIIINEQADGKREFLKDDEGKWQTVMYNDHTGLYFLGERTCKLSESMILTDFISISEDIEVPYGEIQSYVEAQKGDWKEEYKPASTIVEVKDDEVVSIRRYWHP